MKPRPHRNLVVWSQSMGSAGRNGASRLARTGRTRRQMRIGVLLTVVGLMRLGRAMRARWRPLLAGGVLTAGGFMLRGGAGGVIALVGVMFLLSALLLPVSPKAARVQRSKLERELAGYSTPAERCDLEAILDQYPDDSTNELRGILAGQAMTAYDHRFPAIGRD
jgi:hypothetical protein